MQRTQPVKKIKAFRIPFISKKQLKSRQALHRIFLKPRYKVYRGASILYFNASFSDVPSFSKISQSPGQNQETVNSAVYHHCLSRLDSSLTLTFIAFSFEQILNNSILLVHIANCSLYLHYMYVFHCNNFEYFCVLLLLSIVCHKIFLLTSSSDSQCIWCFTLCSCCIGYFLI